MCEGKYKSKMLYAFNMMLNVKRYEKLITPKEYENFRIQFSQSCCGENHYTYGQIFTSKWGIGSRPNAGKNNYFYGKTHTEDSKKRMSETKKIRPMSKEGRESISNYRRGNPLSNETKIKMSQSTKGRVLAKFPCDKCGRLFDKGNLVNHNKANKCYKTDI